MIKSYNQHQEIIWVGETELSERNHPKFTETGLFQHDRCQFEVRSSKDIKKNYSFHATQKTRGTKEDF